jgi:hypothetical protein
MITIMRAPLPYVLATLALSRAVTLFAAQAESPKAEAQVERVTPTKPSSDAVPPEENTGRNRAGENILGQADTSQGEARRNENVQINLLDTNATRELNVRVGTTATIVQEFVADRGYWAAEYGTPPRSPIRAQPRALALRNSVLESQQQYFSARSFFEWVP